MQASVPSVVFKDRTTTNISACKNIDNVVLIKVFFIS
jgi:hypothetical protein